jgi:outer membrane protein assembly factor BamB
MNATSHDKKKRKKLRLWPGITILILMLIARFIIPIVAPEALLISVFSGVLGAFLILIWWAFFSRAPMAERWGGILLMVAAILITQFFIDESIATGGSGMMFYLFAIPYLAMAFVLWATITKNMSRKVRMTSLLITVLVFSGGWIFLRNDGITGEFDLDLNWRWATTPEELLLEKEGEITGVANIETSTDSIIHWSGFRGNNRDGIVERTKINNDWNNTPPKELWRRPIGPGCSSFAVMGNYLFTQEQRGEMEVVSCYELNTGEPVWQHQDEARFWDSHAGAGPRSTPTIDDGRIYTIGATGIVNVLESRDGSLVWTRNAKEDTGNNDSGWGYSSSPIVTDNAVIIAAIGQLVAYDKETGDILWKGPEGGDSYSSPQLITLDSIPQVLLCSGKGVVSLDPLTGETLWNYTWSGDSRIVQPGMTDNGDLLIQRTDGNALRRIAVNHEDDQWNFTEKWTSTSLRPNFNDLVIHDGYAYGFHGPALVCMDLKTGMRQWRGNRYGGQVMLLADQDLLIVLSEQGEVALVEANSDQFSEIGIIQAIEGKTWNHPAMAGNILLVRNTEEMAAYDIEKN